MGTGRRNGRLRGIPADRAGGRGQYGLSAFLDGYLDSLLTCGRAIGEIVPARGEPGHRGAAVGRVEDIEIREGDNPLALPSAARIEQGRMGPLPYQELLLFTPLNPEAENPYGVSLLRGCRF